MKCCLFTVLNSCLEKYFCIYQTRRLTSPTSSSSSAKDGPLHSYLKLTSGQGGGSQSLAQTTNIDFDPRQNSVAERLQQMHDDLEKVNWHKLKPAADQGKTGVLSKVRSK